MSEEGRPDRAGTIWDWPVAVILIALLLLLFAGRSPGAVLLLVFGVVALLIRRGAFTPRR